MNISTEVVMGSRGVRNPVGEESGGLPGVGVTNAESCLYSTVFSLITIIFKILYKRARIESFIVNL